MSNRKLKGYERPTEAFLKAHSKSTSNEAGKEKEEKKTVGTDSRKVVAHSGIKFKTNVKKKTIVQPFSFHYKPKNEKETAGPSKSKSVEKPANTDEKCATDLESQVKIVNDTLKIPRRIKSQSKEKSPVKEKVIESVIQKTSTPKSSCSRGTTRLLSDTVGCDREAQPDATKAAKSLKTEKSEVKSLKVSKIQTLKSSKMTKIETHCSKISKVEIAKTSVQVSNTSTAKSSCINLETTEANLKGVKSLQFNKCNKKKSECASSNSHLDAGNTEKLGSANGEKSEFACTNRETAECAASISKDVESDASNTDKIELVNGGTPECEHAIIADAESEIFNGTSSESEMFNGIKSDLNATKVASKIPRITSGAPTVLKCSSKNETIPESFSFENRCPNAEKQPTNNEDCVLVN